MNPEYINTTQAETITPPELTVHLEEYGDGVWVDASDESVKITVGETKLELYGRSPETGLIDGVEVPDDWVGVVVQPGHPQSYEGEGFVPIVQTEDNSFVGLDIGRGEFESARLLLDPSVSRHHVTIVPDHDVVGQFFVVDAGSTSGTTVTGQEAVVYGEYADMSQHWNEQSVDLSSTVERHALVPDEEVAAITPETIRGRTEAETTFLQTMLEVAPPEAGVILDSGDYFISKPITIAPPYEGTEYSFGLRRNAQGEFSALWFEKEAAVYERATAGHWQLAPSLMSKIRYDPFEGWGREQPRNYIEALKLHESLAAVLEYVGHHSDKQQMDSERIIALRELTTEVDSTARLSEQVDIVKLPGRGVDVLKAGAGYQTSNLEEGRTQLQSMELPEGFEPDFTGEPERTYGIMHEVLGPSQVEVYQGDLEGRPVAWHVATAGDYLWLDRLEYEDSATTTVATQRDVIVAGALTVRPIERVGDYNKWGELGVDWLELQSYPGYGDMWPIIERMPWAQRYRASQRADSYSLASAAS